jgi:branched-chain amino acid transport system substrate-binding protein
LLRIVGKENLHGMIIGLANWPGKIHDALSAKFVARTKEAWFGHNSIIAYAHVNIFKEALERAGGPERAKVTTAIRGMDITDGPALLFPDGRIKFDAKGRREGAKMVIIQWQNGKLETIYPLERATAAADIS